MNTQNAENIKLHKENFIKYLATIKKNSKVISIDDITHVVRQCPCGVNPHGHDHDHVC